MEDVSVLAFRKYWAQKLDSLKSESHTIANKFPDAASAVPQVCRILGNIQKLSRYTLAKVGESSEKSSIVKSEEENKVTFVKV
jgi:hypothetical protein